MNLREVAASVVRNYHNLWGWQTPRKIVVIESDDWGSIRMPSRSVYEKFRAHGMDMSAASYNRYDALESNNDLHALLEVLRKHVDQKGNPACITANMIMANPDFEKIRDAGYTTYFYEKVQDTLRHYPLHDTVFSMYQQGYQESLFIPQFHGREHVQINRWLMALRQAGAKMQYAFDHQTTYSGSGDYSFMESFDWDSSLEVEQHREIIRDGLALFKEAFGFSSKSFIAPCYTWDSAIEPALIHSDVKYMQGAMDQYIPQGGFANYTTRRHRLGEEMNELIYLVRNCFFEPSLVSKPDWVGYTMLSIADSFRWNKPAIICSHRLNYIGSIDESNRIENLQLLDLLLAQILKTWHDVEFMSSDKLGNCIQESPRKSKIESR